VKSAVALWATLALLGLALLPATWILGREAFRRWKTTRALRQIAEGQKLVAGAAKGDVGPLAHALAKRFDAQTNERVVLSLLRSSDASQKEWGSRLFGELKLVDEYCRRLREAPRWSEREHAASILGLAGLSSAVPALVGALRDRNEDRTSVKSAAAAALAQLRDETAIPLLVETLAEADEQSSRTIAEALTAFGTMATPALLGLLADPSQGAARVWAARVLGRIGDPRAVDDLVARLHDRDDRLRMAAAEALGSIGDPRALQPIVRATLRDPAPQVRAHAAGAVARIEGERGVDVLVAALADPDYATRIRALEAFETMHVSDTSPLEAALRDPNAEVRRRAALALERVGYLDRVVAKLASGDRAERASAYSALMMLGEVGLVDSIASYVHGGSFEVRAAAARACGDLGVARFAPLLLRAIDDEAWPVRASVCEALGRLKHDDAPAALVRTLADPEEAVREAASEALVGYAPALLAPHLAAFVAAYETGSVVVRRSLVVIIGRLQGPAADFLLTCAASDPSDTVRLPAVAALGERPDLVKVEPLVARLNDASLEVRMAAITALGSVARTEAFEGLLRALPGAPPAVRDRIAASLAVGARDALFDRLDVLERSDSLDVRLGVVWTLGKIGDRRGVRALARFLTEPFAQLRASAAGALAKIPCSESLEALLVAAEDPDGRVRAAVVNALARVGQGDPRATLAIEARTGDPDTFVRNRALIALALVGGVAVEARVRRLGVGADAAARTVALALVGSEESLISVFEVLGQDGALESMLAYMENEDPRVRQRFFASLRLEDPASASSTTPHAFVAQYERTLRTSLDAEARMVAVQALARIQLDRAVPVLCDAAVGDPAETVRLAATRALASSVSSDAARRALITALADLNSEVALAAVRALEKQRDPKVIAALRSRLGAGSDDLQEAVEATLADMHRDDTLSFVDWMMGNQTPEILAAAVRVLGRLATPEMVPLFGELLRSRFVLVRAEAVKAVAQLSFAQVADVLMERAEDPSEEVRISVIEAVGSTPHALTRLAALRRDPSVRVRAAAARALERLSGTSGRAAHRALEAMLGDASPVVRAAALASLAGSREPEGLRSFAEAWGRTSQDTRMELKAEPRAAALSDRIASRLATGLAADERRFAVVALGAFNARGFALHVLPALRDPSALVRIAAIQALAAESDDDVRDAVNALLSDPDADVRDVARRTHLHLVG
jgi:HEAT repeat protein